MSRALLLRSFSPRTDDKKAGPPRRSSSSRLTPGCEDRRGRKGTAGQEARLLVGWAIVDQLEEREGLENGTDLELVRGDQSVIDGHSIHKHLHWHLASASGAPCRLASYVLLMARRQPALIGEISLICNSGDGHHFEWGREIGRRFVFSQKHHVEFELSRQPRHESARQESKESWRARSRKRHSTSENKSEEHLTEDSRPWHLPRIRSTAALGLEQLKGAGCGTTPCLPDIEASTSQPQAVHSAAISAATFAHAIWRIRCVTQHHSRPVRLRHAPTFAL